MKYARALRHGTRGLGNMNIMSKIGNTWSDLKRPYPPTPAPLNN